ncbi:AlbA family DNA-binding domain-containing protein [Thermaerobacillus caldiproteolyticus]|uniref:AlbA family DNA-binding domain-containing protein n=1 Tax=Thermaerobacillus caldiproteolyticus TaxID=247480 RepID=UPI0018F17780|nr:ATP-binding protein [Anoxybacillus caldiproteolyticus]
MIKQINKQEFLNTFNLESKELDKASLVRLIRDYYGESNELDFKETLIEKGKLAKHILAMVNSGGGTIIFGISDNNKPVGIEDNQDITDIQKQLSSLLPEHLNVYSQKIKYENDELYGEFSNKTFLIFHIPTQNRYIPFLAKKSSGDLKDNVIYIRKNSSTTIATNNDIENMIKKRVYEVYQDLSSLSLEEHLNQLKILYSSISKYNQVHAISAALENVANAFWLTKEKNKHYPRESFDEFISRMINKKKKKIEKIIEVLDVEDE